MYCDNYSDIARIRTLQDLLKTFGGWIQLLSEISDEHKCSSQQVGQPTFVLRQFSERMWRCRFTSLWTSRKLTVLQRKLIQVTGGIGNLYKSSEPGGNLYKEKKGEIW